LGLAASMCGRRPIQDFQNKKPATDFSVRACDFRDVGIMPVICPTCQTVFWRSTIARKFDETAPAN